MAARHPHRRTGRGRRRRRAAPSNFQHHVPRGSGQRHLRRSDRGAVHFPLAERRRVRRDSRARHRAFAAGLLGGGDVKLLAASAIWVDLRHAVWLVALIFLAGGVLAILYLMSRPFRAQRSKRIPYGIAIAIGALAVIGASRGLLQHQERPLPALKIVRPAP